MFNNIFRSNKMPEEWRRSILVPIYKNKGDIQSYTNYREIKLMSHTMKLWARVIERRLRGMTQISINQFGFMPVRSTTEEIFLKSNRDGDSDLPSGSDNYRCAENDTPIRLQIETSNPTILAPQLLSLSTETRIRLTSPRRLIPAYATKNTSKNKKENNQITDE